MGLSEKHLYNDEQIVVDLHPHWWYLTPRAVLLVCAMVLGGITLGYDLDNETLQTGLRWVSAALIVVALVAFLVRVIGWRTTNFVVTTDRCIYRGGVLKKTGIEIPLERINTVFFSQTLFERMLKAGDLAIESAGEGSRQTFSDIKDPVRVQNTIYRQMEENENRKYDRIGGEARQAAHSVVSGSSLSVSEQIEKLAELRDRGVLSEDEFQSQKAQLLAG